MEERKEGMKSMVRHILLWTLTQQAKDEGIEFVLKKLRASAQNMVGKIPGLLRSEVAINQTPGPHDLVFYCEFRSMEDIAPYSEHPLHRAHRDMAKDWVTDRECIDIEVEE